MAGFQDAQEIVQRRANIPHINLYVREGRGAQGDDHLAGVRRLGNRRAGEGQPRRGVDPVEYPWAPVSSNGMRPSRTASSRARVVVDVPITRRPRSANERASGRPTRPNPTTATSALLCGTLIRALRLAASATRPLAQVAGVLRREGRQETRGCTGHSAATAAAARASAGRPTRAQLAEPGAEPVARAPRGSRRRPRPLPAAGGCQTRAHLVHPELLLGLSDADPDDGRPRRVDLSCDLLAPPARSAA